MPELEKIIANIQNGADCIKQRILPEEVPLAAAPTTKTGQIFITHWP